MVYMGKKAGMLFVLLFLLVTGRAEANTVLKESTPAEGQTMDESVQELTLIFSTKVEKVRSLTVSKASGETIEANGIRIEDDTVKAAFAEPLQNESYTVNWEIIGADGHPMTGSMSFAIEAPESQEPLEGQSVPEEETTTGQSEMDREESSDNEKTDSEQTENGTPVVYIVLGAAVLVLIISFWWILKRKK